MTIRILDIVDMQKGFVCRSGNLPIPGAESLIEKANDFLSAVPKDAFAAALFKQDTHFAGEYAESPEGKMFPLHCAFGTEDWELVVNPELLSGKCPVCHMMKNVFDMWGEKPESGIEGTWTEKNMHSVLFDVSWNDGGTDTGCSREEFFKDHLGGFENLEVVMFGVASDYCNRWAMEGYLARGAKVVILEDLTKGIAKETADVVAEEKYADYLASGQLRITSAQEFLQSCAPKPKNPAPAPKP